MQKTEGPFIGGFFLPIACFKKVDQHVPAPPLPPNREKSVGVPFFLDLGCVLRTNKHIYYLETQVLSERVVRIWFLRAAIIRSKSVKCLFSLNLLR